MINTDFNSLVQKVTGLLVEEQKEPKKFDKQMLDYGYGAPQPGDDEHTTFTKQDNDADQILLDAPANEWHHMTKGVVDKVGKMDNVSLEKYLNQKS